MHGIKKGYKTLLLVVGLGILFVVASEIGLRFFTSFDPVEVDPVLGYRANMSAPGWDADGYRNRAVLATSTIVALGDSQTYGNNATVDQAWPQQVGIIATTSVYQMAVPGYGPVQYAALFDQALAHKPKVVIAGLYLGGNIGDAYDMAYTNDNWKALRTPGFAPPSVPEAATSSINYRIVLQTGLSPGSFGYNLYEIRLWMRAHSLLYARLGDLTRTFREQVGVAKTKSEQLQDVASFAASHPDLAYVFKDPNVATVMSPSYYLDTIDMTLPRVAEGWRITKELFTQMRDKANAAGAHFVVLVIPTKEESYMEYFKMTGRPIPDAFVQYEAEVASMNATLKSFCAAQLISCIFPTDTMAAHLSEGDKVYSGDLDKHPTPLGYHVIAQLVAHTLQTLRYIP